MKPQILDRYFYERIPYRAVGPGRGTTPGGHIADLVSLGKAITLCELCFRKFHPERHGYRWSALTPTHHYVYGDCDGCRNAHVRCRLFLKGR